MSNAKAEAIIHGNLRADEVVLNALGIDKLDPLLPHLAQLTRLRKLKLAKNNLTALPDDLTALRNLEYLDLSGNRISGLNAVIRGLLCLTNLKHLFVDLPYETDEDEIIVSLHSLESFNGTPLTETFEDGGGDAGGATAGQSSSAAGGRPSGSGAAGNSGGRPQSWQAMSTGNAAPPLGAKTRWDDGDMSQVQRLYQAANSVSGRVVNKAEFDEYTRNVVAHLNTLLTGEEDPFKRESEILKAKKIMFEYCFEEVARSSHRFDANLSQVLSVLQDTYAHLLDNYDGLVRNINEDKERKLDVMKADMQHAIQEIEQLMQQIDGKGGDASGGGSKTQFEAERRKLNEEIGWLRAENEKLNVRIRQAESARGGAIGGATPAKSAIGNMLHQQHSPGRSASGMATTSKVLTQRQLRDVIEDIYASKSRYDIKCAETHLPRETMEQHMYTYLNQKYGLKHLILEWATAIIQGVKKYSADDNDVAVFGKVLRNEIDEEFRFVQRQLKETVNELLRVYLKGKMPLKGDEEINNMVKKRLTGTVSEEEWVDIVKYMYNTEDSVTIIMRVKDLLKQRAQPRRRTTRRSAAASDKEEPANLLYSEFLRILLDFQLEGHERFLSKFVRIFKQFDTDRNGVVNEFEFRQILKSIDSGKSDEEANALLDLIDPHNNQLITFSECVTFLSSELVKLMREESGR